MDASFLPRYKKNFFSKMVVLCFLALPFVAIVSGPKQSTKLSNKTIATKVVETKSTASIQKKVPQSIPEPTTTPEQTTSRSQETESDLVAQVGGTVAPTIENPRDYSDFLKTISPWLQNNAPANISLSFVEIALGKKFCDRYEVISYNAELDFRIWLKERNMSIAHVATNEAFGLIPIRCGSKDDARYSIFFNNQIITRDDLLTIAVKVYENDQIFTDSKQAKFQKMVKENLGSTGNVSVDKGIVAESYSDQIWKKLSLLLYPITIWDDLYDSLNDETAISTFEIDLYRKALYLPSTENVPLESRGIEVLIEGGGKDFIEFRRLRDMGIDHREKDFLNKLIAIRYRFTTEANHLFVTFEQTVKKL